MKIFHRAGLFILMALLIFSCSKSNTPTVGNPPVTPPIPSPIMPLPAGWKMALSYMTAFPEGIQLFFFDTIFNGQKLKAFCLAYNSKSSRFEFKPVLSASAKTPSSFFASEPGVTFACINGGFFGSNQSYSLVQYNQTVLSPNIKTLTRTYNGANTAYFPTRAAFGFNATGTPSVSWIYHVGSGNDLVFGYPSPSPNELNLAPQPVPTENFPSGGAIWSTVSAIGGAPVLIKDNQVRVTDKEELISINNTSSRPRSAIGYLSNGVVLLVVVEGDNLPIYPGINLADLASMLKSLGCYEAINLDGGGSTSMIVNSTKTVRPGDAGVERPVVSAILIKQK